MAVGFAAKINDFALRTKRATREVFNESVMEMVDQMQALVPQDTGFLRASLEASNSRTPSANQPNPGGAHNWDRSETELVIMNTKLGQKICLGYRANYAPYVHYGANGRPPNPWVDLVVQRWSQIVEDKTKEVKARYKL